MNTVKINAIMPIKLNNERFPGKNTKLLGDRPLLQYELLSLKKIDNINNIYVYCSSEDVCKFLPSGVIFLKRPDFLDLPTSNFTQIFENFISTIDSDIYIYAHATAPFITLRTMKKCIDAVISGEFDSAFCAIKIQDFLWRNGNPLNFDAQNIPRSQDIEPIYRETSGIYVFTKQVFTKYKRRIGIKPYMCEVSYKEAIDINTPDDFKLAEFFLDYKEE